MQLTPIVFTSNSKFLPGLPKARRFELKELALYRLTEIVPCQSDGMINCEVISPRKPGREWQFFSAFLGRLADRYTGDILGINIQFPGSTGESGRAKVKKPRRIRRRK